MATIEISVTHKRTRQVKLHQIIDTTNELAQALIEQIEAMIARLPAKQVAIARSITPNGGSIIDIEMGGPQPLPVTSPTFEERYRRHRPPQIVEVKDATPNPD